MSKTLKEYDSLLAENKFIRIHRSHLININYIDRLDKKGSGIHHIAYRVDNLVDTLKRLQDKGFRLIDEFPRDGAEGKKIAFIHPKSTNGILIELCEA